MRCPWCRERDAVEAAVCPDCLAALASTGYSFEKPPDEQTEEAGPFYKNRVSASALASFVRCPEQYRRERLLGEWSPSSGSQVIGNAIHGGMERYWRMQVVDGGPPDRGVADDMLDAAWAEEVDDDVDWGALDPSSSKDRAAKVFRAYRDRIAPLVMPQLVEQWIRLRVPGCPVDVVGKIDLVGWVPACDSEVWDAVEFTRLPARAVDGVPMPYALRSMHAKLDLKSSMKGAAKQIDPNWRIQGLVYTLVDDLPMTWHSISLKWRGKDGDPILRTCASPDVDDDGLVMHRTAETFASASELVRRLVSAIETYYERYGPDEVWPSGAVAHLWACGLCQFKERDCVYWHGAAREWNLEPEGAST